MARIERKSRAAFFPGLGGGERLLSSKLADFAGKLAHAMSDDRRFVTEAVASHHIYRAFQDQPHRDIALPHIEHDLARRKVRCRSAREPFRRLDLSCIEYGKELMTTGSNEAHRVLFFKRSLTCPPVFATSCPAAPVWTGGPSAKVAAPQGVVEETRNALCLAKMVVVLIHILARSGSQFRLVSIKSTV